MKIKEGFLTIDEQIKLLQLKPFVLPKNIKNILERVNYYTLMSFKNIFYINGVEHQYKENINFEDFYKLYNYDVLIKQDLLKNFINLKHIYTNLLSNYFGCYEKCFIEQGYLNKKLYKKNIIFHLYKRQLKNNTDVKKYYIKHKFLPIWVLLNSLSYTEFINYILDFKENVLCNIGVNDERDSLTFSVLVFDKIISTEKIYDVQHNNLNLNNILILFKNNGIDTKNFISIYEKISNNIPCINNIDIFRETKIKLEDNLW